MLQGLTAYARLLPVWLVYLVGFIPGVWVWYAAFNNKLGADPLAVLEHETGIWALRFLIAALAITPLLRMTLWLRSGQKSSSVPILQSEWRRS